jgi:uncharacterized protein YegP (UPF0339 family)
MYFQLVKTSAGWHARIKGANHEIVFSTQVYSSKASALNACTMVQGGASSAKIYETTA